MVVEVVRLPCLDAVEVEIPLLEAAHDRPGLDPAAMLVEEEALDLGPWSFLVVEFDDQVLVLVEVHTSPSDHFEQVRIPLVHVGTYIQKWFACIARSRL